MTKRAPPTAERSRSVPSADHDDPRVAKLLASLRADPKLTPVIDAFEKAKGQPGRKFGSNGLKVNGKLFALFTQGTLVVKLPKDRVAELVASRVGKPFDSGHGRLMKEWLAVTSAKVSWVELAKEAFDFVRPKSG
jgi:hypothetical protein